MGMWIEVVTHNAQPGPSQPMPSPALRIHNEYEWVIVYTCMYAKLRIPSDWLGLRHTESAERIVLIWLALAGWIMQMSFKMSLGTAHKYLCNEFTLEAFEEYLVYIVKYGDGGWEGGVVKGARIQNNAVLYIFYYTKVWTYTYEWIYMVNLDRKP